MTRDGKGRFVPGNEGGPGRPAKSRELRYYEITLSTCSFDDWEAIVKTAVEQAKRGDKDARKWLGDYLVGAPEQRLDITSNGKTVFDYETAITAIAPGSASDSQASGAD